MTSVSPVVRPILYLAFSITQVFATNNLSAFAQAAAPTPGVTPVGQSQFSSVSSSGSAASVPLASAAVAPTQPASFRPTALGQFVDRLNYEGWNSLPPYLWQTPPILNSVAASPAVTITMPQLPEGDGVKAAILQEYGLQAFTRKSFQRGQRYIHIDLFEFANNNGAFAAYSYLRRGATTIVLRGDATSEDDDSISFVQGKTFISIYGTSADDDESKDVIRSVAAKVSKAIAETGAPPYILATMPQLEFLRGSEKIVMGPISARRFFPAPYLTSLDFKQAKLACVADYQMREPVKERVKLLLIDYAGNNKAARESYQSYVGALCQAHDENPDLRLAQDSNQFRNGATFCEIQLHGSRVFMVAGARKKYSAELLLRQIR